MSNKIFQSPSAMVRHFLKPYKGVFASLIAFIPLSVIAGQLIPWYTAQIINMINDNENKAEVVQKLLPEFLKLAALLVAATVIGVALFLMLQYKCIAPAGIAIRKELFSEMLKKDRRFWNTHSAGDIWGKIDLTRRSIASYSSLGSLFYDGYAVLCSIIIAIFLLAKISLSLACCFTILGSVALVFYYYISNNIKKVSVLSAKFETSVLGKVVNTLANFFILKANGTEKQEQKNLERSLERLVKAKQKKEFLALKNYFMLEILILSFYLGIIFYAIYLWTGKEIFVGDIVYIMAAATSFCRSISAVSYLFPFIKSRMAILKENIKVFALENEVYDVKGAQKLKVSNGAIEFTNLRFSYDGKKEVLKGITLSIKPREKIGIVGISGSGKTTLLHLLLKLVNAPSGMIFIDNQDITKVTAESLYNAAGYIAQDTSLFHRTILENIKYGKMSASDKAVKKAAVTAFADDFIKTLPLKYNTPVGDKGVKLSGGERQRVGIARAVLKNAPILLLDEATSALDSESENYIQQAIDEIIKDKTVIAVAHRLSTLKNMDRIIVLQNGKIVEEGAPDELLRKKGKFFKLWELQKGKK